MKKQLQKTMIGLLGTAAFTGLSTKAIATPITADLTSFIGNAGTYTSAVTPVHAWDGGNIGFGPGGAGDCAANDCTALPAVGRGRVGGADSMNGSVETTRNFGWSHTIKWYTFNVANSGGYTISMDRLSANINNQPAFSVWSSGANAWDGTGGS
ncbi:MAG: hypothetical protein H6R26_2672, partial [Proteobacteria bacterium]|nr:hypothetical protein [Pseudomonadota bacterium]